MNTITNRTQILIFGLAAVAALIGGSLAVDNLSQQPLLVLGVYSIAVPLACVFVLLVWLSEAIRSHRAGHYLASVVEARINAKFRKLVMSWEACLWTALLPRDELWGPSMVAVGIFGVMAVASPVFGVLLQGRSITLSGTLLPEIWIPYAVLITTALYTLSHRGRLRNTRVVSSLLHAPGPTMSDPTEPAAHPDITNLLAQLEAAARDAAALVAGLSEEHGARRVQVGSWSVAECLDHLATGNRVYLAAMREPAERARLLGRKRRRPVRPGWAGRLFVYMLEPPPKWWCRMKAPRSIRPRTSPPLAETFASFVASHADVCAFLRAHADLDLAGIRFPNPFVRGIRFSLATGLHVIAAHERRHLWQAWRVRRAFLRDDEVTSAAASD